MRLHRLAVASLLAGTLVNVKASEPAYVHFTSKLSSNTNLRYIIDSGVCETTPGVTQYSGYIDVGTNMSMWFWFFEARQSPETAPFTLWLNGGPGCSSMIGLFQENGPCQVNPDGQTTTLNPYSWNTLSNMIYIDQPIGSGFSYGSDTVNSTEAAAPFVWKAFQVLFESKAFANYASREFIFATESYGGHYGPAFVSYFKEQNNRITSGAIKGELIMVSALLINNGWFDPLIQNIAYYSFVKNAPGYGQLLSNKVLANLSESLWAPGGCVDQEKACYAAGNSSSSDKICYDAASYCSQYVFSTAIGDRDPYDLRQNSSAFFPPEYYIDYLRNNHIVNRIGANTTYEECPVAPYFKMIKTGDDARTWLPQLSELVNSGLRVLVWVGDADIICNWIGVYAVALAMEWHGKERFKHATLTNITLAGTPIASVANVDNFHFARVFGAGHEVPAFQPAASLEIFRQIIYGERLHSI